MKQHIKDLIQYQKKEIYDLRQKLTQFERMKYNENQKASWIEMEIGDTVILHEYIYKVVSRDRAKLQITLEVFK